MKLLTTSKSRYDGGVKAKQQYGSSTMTEFFVYRREDARNLNVGQSLLWAVEPQAIEPREPKRKQNLLFEICSKQKASKSIDMKKARPIRSGLPVKWQPPPKRPPMSQDEILRTATNIIGYSMVAMSHPKGFVKGLQQMAFEKTHARRWKALAKKYRAELLKLRSAPKKRKPR